MADADTPNAGGATPPGRPAKPRPAPNLGFDVHYVLGDRSPNAGEHRAAKIGFVHPDDNPDLIAPVNLNWMIGKGNDDPAGNKAPWFLALGVGYDATGKTPGTWHYPEATPGGKK